MTIRVIDLFSGPGGLGEGFTSLESGKAFRIAVSAEMETSAHATLTLRAFFRSAKLAGDKKALSSYYAFCNSNLAAHPSGSHSKLWAEATSEARQLELGKPECNQQLDCILEQQKLGADDTILIGGPPCQAYSSAGRSRNKGKVGYVPEEDKRHYLYREYLRVLAKTLPAVFVMENVRGILSATPGGKQIFYEILTDLCDPVRAVNGKSGPTYVIHSMTTDTRFEEGMNPDEIDARNFIIKSEDYGIPQARHRVILLGVREDINTPFAELQKSDRVFVREAISELPMLRSQLSPRRNDSSPNWVSAISEIGQRLSRDALSAGMETMSQRIANVCGNLDTSLSNGDIRALRSGGFGRSKNPTEFLHWVTDPNILVWLNHEARSHMPSDLGRYLYASVFTEIKKISPRGHQEFSLPGLAPDHLNWESGNFVDRFKVQRWDSPSSTITSHISKDGHYFIHPDPFQCRALTVREAARLQTFPDNYFFQGVRTQQFHQVGNAVPPLLANKIAKIVRSIVKS